jgi:hypothetical protein
MSEHKIVEMSHNRTFLYGLLVSCSVTFCSGCNSKPNTTAALLPGFSITNQIVNGKLQQVMQSTNGISFYFADSYFVVWLGTNSDMIVDFDPVSLRLKTVMEETSASENGPAQAVWDMNGDGVPEMRKIKGQTTNEIFYKGEWYAKQIEGTNLVISVDGKDVKVRYDERSGRWIDIAP